MRRRALVAFAVVAVLGIAVLAVVAATDDRPLAFTLGVAPQQAVARVDRHARACQRPVRVEQAFSRVRLTASGSAPLAVTVAELRGGRVLARGRLTGLRPVRSERTVALDRQVPTGASVAVCVGTRGRGAVSVYGGPAAARLGTGVFLGGRSRPTDLSLVFERAEPRSALALVPEMFRRAALFRPGWVGAWTFWVLLVLVLTAVPALLAVALRSSLAGDEAGEGPG